MDNATIIDERLRIWSTMLKQENSTPLLLVGVRHDDRPGQLLVLTLDEADISKDTIEALLRHALDAIRLGRIDNLNGG